MTDSSFTVDLDEFNRWLTLPRNNDACTASTENRKSKTWDLNTGYKGALKTWRTGWTEGLQDAQRRADEFRKDQRLEQPVQQLEHRITGVLPDVAGYLQGVPECMLAVVDDYQPVNILELVISIDASAGIGASDMMRRGIAAWLLVDKIEASTDTRVRVLANTCSTPAWNSGAKTNLNIVLKSEDRMLSPAQLIYAVAHPAFFRRLSFRSWESSPIPAIAERGKTKGYGYPADPILAPGQVALERIEGSNRKRTIGQWLESFERSVEAVYND